MENSLQFQYIYENLGLYTFHNDWLILLAFIFGGLILGVGAYITMGIAALKTIDHDEAIFLARKRKTLGDLILMKDIQTELEKEIEQAILKTAFHT